MRSCRVILDCEMATHLFSGCIPLEEILRSLVKNKFLRRQTNNACSRTQRAKPSIVVAHSAKGWDMRTLQNLSAVAGESESEKSQQKTGLHKHKVQKLWVSRCTFQTTWFCRRCTTIKGHSRVKSNSRTAYDRFLRHRLETSWEFQGRKLCSTVCYNE